MRIYFDDESSNKNKMKRILFVVHAAHRVPDVLAFLKELNDDCEIYVLLCGDLYYQYKEQLEKKKIKTLPFDLYAKQKNGGKKEGKRFPSTRERLKKNTPIIRIIKFIYRYILLNNSFIQLYNEKKLYVQLKKQYDAAVQLMERNKPDLVVALVEQNFGPVIAVLKAAKEKKRKVLIPYFVFATKDALASYRAKTETSYRFRKTFYSSLYTKITFKKFNRQVFRNMLFYPPEMLNAINHLGALSKNPWQIGMGMSDVICVNNRYRHQEFLKNSVPDNKIRVIGDISYDKLYDSYINRHAIREKIEKKYQLNQHKKNILIGLPPLAEHAILDWEAHWKSIDLIVKASAKTGHNALISLHPRMDRERYIFLEKKYQLKIIDERLMEVISSSNLYVSIFSSTLIWSVLCGVNTIVINPAKVKYSYYNFLKSLHIMQDMGDLENAIEKYIDQKIDYREDWEKLSRDQVFDGNVNLRYRALISDLTLN